MPLTEDEYDDLKYWNFISAYQTRKYRRAFEYLARNVFLEICQDFGEDKVLNRKLFEEMLGTAMSRYDPYDDMHKEGMKSHLSKLVYESFASKFGKYVLDRNEHLLNEPCR